MNNKKIIMVFICIITLMIGGYLIYNHQHKVSLAQYYYDTGDFQKCADLKMGDVSYKAGDILSASNWGKDKTDPSKLSFDIDQIYFQKNNIFKDDSYFVSKMNIYYQQIADYLGVDIARLDEIAKNSINNSNGQDEVKTLINNRMQ